MQKSFALLATTFCKSRMCRRGWLPVNRVLGGAMAAALSLGLAGEAAAVQLAFTGSLALEFTFPAGVMHGGGTFAPESITGEGTAVGNGLGGPGHLTQLSIGGDAFSGVRVLDVTDPAAFPISGLQVTAANEAGAFSGSGNAGFGGIMPLNGVAKVCLYGTCAAAAGNISIPLSVVGIGGSAFFKGFPNLTVKGAPWTTGTAAVGTVTVMGSAGPTSATASRSGVVKLVTPIFISVNVNNWEVSPGFAFLTLAFTPEPDLALAGVIAAGAVSLVALGRRRQQERRTHMK
jgi:hypothetical protein